MEYFFLYASTIFKTQNGSAKLLAAATVRKEPGTMNTSSFSASMSGIDSTDQKVSQVRVDTSKQ